MDRTQPYFTVTMHFPASVSFLNEYPALVDAVRAAQSARRRRNIEHIRIYRIDNGNATWIETVTPN